MIRLLPSSITGRVTTNRIVRHPTSIIGRLIRGSVSTNTAIIGIDIGVTKQLTVRIISGNGNVSPASTHVTFRHRTADGVHITSSLFSLTAGNFHNRTLTSVITITRIRVHACSNRTPLNALVRLTNSRIRQRRVIRYPQNAGFVIGGLFCGIPTHEGFLGGSRARLHGVVRRVRHVILARPSITFALRDSGSLVFSLPGNSLGREVMSIFKHGDHAVSSRLITIGTSDSVIGVSNFINAPRNTKGGAPRFFFIGGHFVCRPCFHHTILTTCRGVIGTSSIPVFFLSLSISPRAVSIGVRPAGARVGFRGRHRV